MDAQAMCADKGNWFGTVLQVLREAAEAAVLLTHPSETAADAAAVLAAAIAWCMRCGIALCCCTTAGGPATTKGQQAVLPPAPLFC